MFTARRAPFLLLLLLLGGCVSFVVPDTTALAPAQLNPPDSPTISQGGYRLGNLDTSDDTPDLLVLVAFSGGGKRSSAFAYGALEAMREMQVPTAQGPRRLLDQVDAISAISGGSFTAAYYGLHREATFTRFEPDFLRRNTNANVWGIYLLPWNWGWLLNPDVGTNDYMAQVYDRTMFQGADFAALKRNGRPLIGIGATEISTGTPFLFTQEVFDLLCADLDQLPIASAVAASAAFPGLFSPITLTNRATACAGRSPGWLRAVSEQDRQNPVSRLGAQANVAARYLDADSMRYVHLTDGGVADNLGMRGVGAAMEGFGRIPRAPGEYGLARIRRILILSVDGQAGRDDEVSQRRAVGGLFSVIGLVSGAQIGRLNFDTMIAVDGQLHAMLDAIRTARCERGPSIDGTACDDVDGTIIRLGFDDDTNPDRRARLMRVPTTLTLTDADTDALIAAGHDVLTNSPRVRQFLADYYPPRPAPPPRRARTAGR